VKITNEDFIIIRKVHDLNQYELAVKLNYSQTYVMFIEKNYRKPTDEMNNRLISAFNLTPDKLNKIREFYHEYMVAADGTIRR